MSDTCTEFYVTRFALTKGPIKVKGQVTSSSSIFYDVGDGRGYIYYAHSGDFHTTKESALTDCERRRKAKLASLKKQIAKLEKMEFKL